MSALSLTPTDSVLAVVAGALATHLVFNRFEPTELPVVAALLLGTPSVFSPLLVGHHGILKGTFLTFSVFLATLAASVALYRISPFHPLARYPGPLLAKISRWYWAYIAVQGHQHTEFQHLHEIHGDVVRIGPNELSFRDVSLIQPMMGAQGLPKGPMWDGRTFKPPVLPLVGLRDVQEHARRRRPWTRAFSSAALKEYEPVVARRGAQLVEILAEQKETDFVHWIHLFTFDIMSDALFGGNPGAEMMRTQDGEGVMESMKTGFEAAQVYENIPWLGYWMRHFPQLAQATKRYRTMCFQRGMQRYHAGSKQKDLFYYLSNEDGAEAHTPDKSTVLADSALAIIAGSDTTASVFSTLLFLLLRHPRALARLRAELDAACPPEADALDPQHTARVPYLDAVINETLRLYPVVPSGSQRAPERGSGGAVLGEHFIPEGTSVRVHFWSVHRDARNFARPDAFVPERWLASTPTNPTTPAPGKDLGLDTGLGKDFVHDARAFVPFSAGPWNCVGRGLALLELRCVTAHLLQRLDIRFKEGWDPAAWEGALEDRFVVKTGRLPVVVVRRG
ncbi:cytochrome P450 [Phanerochaete sordida]|uniref:Cytochrome P450 n=1 Tax=Phanerochaete sordida TaxID=48140 RepID=A0A9P3G3W4_9APHY|nr:cytochrome P450 [Phanerochaete sordida]